ncbi:MAG: hypothetical protein JXN65_06860 [Clostridia bacterium]|nr:hypothetical protein [Clostridia bacterium]
MEYLIKYTPHTRGKEQTVYTSNGDVLLTISEKLDALSGKEIIYNNSDEIIYMVDTYFKQDHHQSTIYDASSKEILTVYLRNTYSGLNLYVSCPDNVYGATHKMDMSAIHLYKHSEVAATIRMKKTMFGNNYSLDIKPQRDEAFIHLFAIVITKLLEYNVQDVELGAYAF